jgi:hypothetical protein
MEDYEGGPVMAGLSATRAYRLGPIASSTS